jgi:hypothetical protein
MIMTGELPQRSLAITRNDAASEPGRKPIQAFCAKQGAAANNAVLICAKPGCQLDLDNDSAMKNPKVNSPIGSAGKPQHRWPPQGIPT